jgi:hypothetical protein
MDKPPMRDESKKSSVGRYGAGGRAVLLCGFVLAGCSSETPSAAAGGDAAAGGTNASAGTASAGASATGGSSSVPQGGKGSSGSATAGSTNGAGGGSTNRSDCNDPNLTWKSADKTWYESYPDPGSEECIKYNGCTWAGQFSACDGKKSEAWVQAHDIVSAFPDFETLELHDLCLKSGDKTLVVTVLDTCGDGDCGGCCTQNQGNADELIDIESYTNERWGVDDGPIQWADLGPTRGDGCN